MPPIPPCHSKGKANARSVKRGTPHFPQTCPHGPTQNAPCSSHSPFKFSAVHAPDVYQTCCTHDSGIGSPLRQQRQYRGLVCTHTHTHAGRRCQIYIASRAACFAIARHVQSTTLSALNQRTGAHVDAPSWVAGQSLRNPGRGGGGMARESPSDPCTVPYSIRWVARGRHVDSPGVALVGKETAESYLPRFSCRGAATRTTVYKGATRTGT